MAARVAKFTPELDQKSPFPFLWNDGSLMSHAEN